MHIQFKDNI